MIYVEGRSKFELSKGALRLLLLCFIEVFSELKW